MLADVLSLENDHQVGEPLIQPFMKDGRRIRATEPLNKLREHALEQIKRLPKPLRALEHGPEYPVDVSDAIRRLAQEVDAAQAESDRQAAAAKKSISEQRLT
jgi:nicotinate phosphoribosyltransferase